MYRRCDGDPPARRGSRLALAVLSVPRPECVAREDACRQDAVSDDLPQRYQLLHVVVGRRLPWRISQFVGQILDARAKGIPGIGQPARIVEQRPFPQPVDRIVPLLLAPATQPPAELRIEAGARCDMGDQRLDAAEPVGDKGGDMTVAAVLP